MNSLRSSIYEYPEVIFTLAWLLELDTENNAKMIVSRAIQLGLIRVERSKHWHANERSIFRRLDNPKIAFPHHGRTNELTKILIGFGEISARSNGDFKGVINRKFSSFFYKKSLPKILEEILKTKHYLKRKRSLEEIGYSQSINNTEFDWNGYDTTLRELNFGSRLMTYNYGISFIISLCMRVIPRQYSFFVEKYKSKVFVGDLCYPVIDPLMFRELHYAAPLLKGKNSYLKLLASASVVQQELFGKLTSIEDNLNILTENGIDIGDAIWLTSIKLRDRYLGVKRLKEQIDSFDQEIKLLEKHPKRCPEGVNPTSWIESKKNNRQDLEGRLPYAEVQLKSSFSELIQDWPESGINIEQVENLIHLISNEQLLRELVVLIPSADNRIQILSHNIKKLEDWIGISTKEPLKACENTFSYSSNRDFEQLVNAAKSLIMLADDKNRNLGRLLGAMVMRFDTAMEGFVTRPFIRVRKPSLWQSATSRLASVHLLALCIVDQASFVGKEYQVSPIMPAVIDKINLLLKVCPPQFNSDADQLFRDLKRNAAHEVATKNSLTKKASAIANDKYLPSDYRVRVIFTSQVLSKSHWKLAVELFESFSLPPIYVNEENQHFSEWICLLDLCIAYCWKYECDQAAQGIIRIWEHYCPMYGDEYTDYQEYARMLYTALQKEGEERCWLKMLDGFAQSNCMNVLQ